MNDQRMHGRGETHSSIDRKTAETMALLEDLRGKRRPQRTPVPPQEPQAQPSRATDICLIRIGEVLAICGKSRSSVYELIQKGTFPAPVKLGGRSSAWIKAEVLAWIENCIRSSRGL
ncbi:helix-turn-helix transcriptional regulator [Duganella sp. BuS-21]|uniref:helix-turn-helix transcriptional regulator n=1 Tax=Duganella sp. BuS-21 TaxID=2943848 RepID=UPI0035A6A92A